MRLHEIAPHLTWPEADGRTRHHVLTECTLAYMDAVGIDAALLFPVDIEWAESATVTFPTRFACVRTARLPEQVLPESIRAFVAEQKRRADTVALRLVLGLPGSDQEFIRLRQGVYDPLLCACQEHRLPLFVFSTGDLRAMADLAAGYPDLQFILDHLGLPQPPIDDRESPPWRSLPRLLTLADYPNIAVKLCGAPTLTESQFPFADLWPHVSQICDAFGVDRLMWASDISRIYGRIGFERRFPRGEGAYPGKHTYADALQWIRDTEELSAGDKQWILGGTVTKVLGWDPDPLPFGPDGISTDVEGARGP